MKSFKKAILLLLLLTIHIVRVQSQDSRESEIRRLENLERESVLKSDSLTLFGKIWSDNMIVNTPGNMVGTVEGTKSQLRKGLLNYLSFERDIENISFFDNIAVVMGAERIKPQGKQMNAGKLVTRRFTNVWSYEDLKWTLIARQATIIKVE